LSGGAPRRHSILGFINQKRILINFNDSLMRTILDLVLNQALQDFDSWKTS